MWPPSIESGKSLLYAADSAARVALEPYVRDGDTVVELDTHTMYMWNSISSTWSIINSSTVTVGDLTTTSPLHETGGFEAVLGTGVNITVDDASTSQKGVVELSNSYIGTSQVLATTEKALSDGLATKQATGNYITALTSDISASGPGSSAATIQPNVVGNSKLAQAPANTLKGNNTGSTANESDLTVSQVQTMLSIPATPVSISNGGTGQTTQAAAITALTGSQTPGYVLRSDGVNSYLAAIQATDVPILNQNTTGTASNITATSNSTLTTLSSLSLPGSQVSGNISGNSANVTGTVAIANGGTGQTTQQLALDALAGSVTSAQYLRGTGTHVQMSSIQASDVPILNQSTTGTASNVTGIVAIVNGGTGQTTASAAFNALSPNSTKGDITVYDTTTNSRLAVGSNGQVLKSDSTQTLGVKWDNITTTRSQSFLTSGTTYTTPSNITTATYFKFTLIGGGGGGGGSSSTTCSAGGGGGGGLILWTTGLSPSTGYTIAIGSGGTAGAATPTAGGNGGDTTLTISATTYTASGGVGGPTSSVAGGAGGAATNGTINISGRNGGGGSGAATSPGGMGGDSPWGWGHGGANNIGNAVGLAGSGYGAGGGGGRNAAGAAGTSGCILVEWVN